MTTTESKDSIRPGERRGCLDADREASADRGELWEWGVMDNCSETGCSAGIDLDDAQMCEKCRQCFCDDHLYAAPKGINGFLCNECILKYDGVDNEDAEEWQHE